MSSKAATTRSRCRRGPVSDNRISTTQSRTTSPRGCARRPASGQRDERSRDGAADEGLAGLPLGGGVEGFEKLHLAAGEERHRNAVAIEHAVAGQRRELGSGGRKAGEIEGVGARQ